MVAHHGKIRAARHAHAHDRGNLGNAYGTHHRVVAKNAAKVVGVGENIFLQRQKNAGGIYQINCRDVIVDGHVLRANDLFGGHGEERPGFHRGVIRDNHKGAATNHSQARNRAGAGRAAPLLVHFEGRVNTQLEELRAGINQLGDALARGQAPFLVLRLNRLGAATLKNLLFFIFDFRKEIDHAACVLFEFGGFAIGGSFQNGSGHARPSRILHRW